ncbi:MAG TPA: hypothetical protein VMH81_29905 [Bryobacteraceae bacterium]|nr:hypothetical protein [Bryobacteraceae bacterium]
MLSSCSSQPVVTAAAQKDAAFYWSAAKECYMAGDYLKAIAHLDHLTEAGNPYNSRALPFAVVLTSGVASGYMELADYYAAGAKANKRKATIFQSKAADYRALANHVVLLFAEDTRKLSQVEGDSIQLAFGPPKGNFAEPVLLTQISHGMIPAQTDEEAALQFALDRGVLLSVCDSAGAPNNLAKAGELLQRGEFLVRRSKFTKAVADQLQKESQLYARNKLDDSQKMEMLRQMSRDVVKDPGASRTAMAMQVPSR